MKLLLIFASFFVSFCVADPICTNGFTLVNSAKCLKFFATPVKHRVAETSCASYGGALVTIRNAIDNRAVSTFVGNSGFSFWIGVFCVSNDPSTCYFDDDTGSASAYNNFARGFPNVDLGGCVYSAATGSLAGQWISSECENVEMAYVCEIPTTRSDTCAHNFNGYCYLLSHENATSPTLPFSAALDSCHQNCADLVSIHSKREISYIQSLYTGSNISTTMIGALTTSPLTPYWIDQSRWDYNHVSPRSGSSGSCFQMAVSTDGTWYQVDCKTSQYFVCKRPNGITCNNTPAPPVIVTPAPTNPSGCNSTTLFDSGYITSPNYPTSFVYSYCVYKISTLGPYRIGLYFSDIYTYDSYTSVQVLDSDGKVLGTFRQAVSPFPYYYSSSNILTVISVSTTNQGYRDSRPHPLRKMSEFNKEVYKFWVQNQLAFYEQKYPDADQKSLLDLMEGIWEGVSKRDKTFFERMYLEQKGAEPNWNDEQWEEWNADRQGPLVPSPQISNNSMTSESDFLDFEEFVENRNLDFSNFLDLNDGIYDLEPDPIPEPSKSSKPRKSRNLKKESSRPKMLDPSQISLFDDSEEPSPISKKVRKVKILPVPKTPPPQQFWNPNEISLFDNGSVLTPPTFMANSSILDQARQRLNGAFRNIQNDRPQLPLQEQSPESIIERKQRRRPEGTENMIPQSYVASSSGRKGPTTLPNLVEGSNLLPSDSSDSESPCRRPPSPTSQYRPPPPSNAIQIFIMEQGPKNVYKKEEKLKYEQRMREMWMRLNDEQRKPYRTEAKRLLQIYMKEYPDAIPSKSRSALFPKNANNFRENSTPTSSSASALSSHPNQTTLQTPKCYDPFQDLQIWKPRNFEIHHLEPSIKLPSDYPWPILLGDVFLILSK
ncbi:hypothetical protein L5515_013289 [Caenorhabditis briggsae]|uniref:C-type LECtin n=3 Tax=Caenorhabditis briggsae TaxID=6238 RepID=A0AAE9E7S6_CAEBR|nr:hypothetical protein L5515_013289 [Caenorhabditis briggsae]